MSRFDDPNFKNLHFIANSMGADVLLSSTKVDKNRFTFSISVVDKDGKMLVSKSQFRDQTIDDIASDLLNKNTDWIKHD